MDPECGRHLLARTTTGRSGYILVDVVAIVAWPLIPQRKQSAHHRAPHAASRSHALAAHSRGAPAHHGRRRRAPPGGASPSIISTRCSSATLLDVVASAVYVVNLPSFGFWRNSRSSLASLFRPYRTEAQKGEVSNLEGRWRDEGDRRRARRS